MEAFLLSLELADAVWLAPILKPLLAAHRRYDGLPSSFCTRKRSWWQRLFNRVDGCHRGHGAGSIWRSGGPYVL